MLSAYDNSKINGGRNQAIDLLKGICILFVILTHFSWSPQEELDMGFPFWVDLAVPVFMVISFYVNCLSFNRKGIVTVADAYQVKNWLKSFVRYTVPYLIIYFVEAVALLVYSLTDISVGEGYAVTWQEYILAFFSGGWGPGSYYYPILVQLLFFFPFIFVVINRYGGKGLLGCFLFTLVWEIIKLPLGITASFYRLNIFRYTYWIAFGAYLAQYGNSDNGVTKSTLLGAVYSVMCIIVIKYTDYAPHIFTYWASPPLFAAMLCLPFASILILNVQRVSKVCSPLTYIGKASYHIFFAQMALSPVIPSVVSPRYLALVVDFAACIAVGIVFYLAETPLNRKITNALYKQISVKQTKQTV